MVLESRTQTGRRGEAWALQTLITPSRQLLATNWRWHRHEIDAVFMELDTVVFLEVKSWTGCGTSLTDPLPSTAQQRRIVRAAHAFMRCHRLQTHACRFDLATVCFHRRDGTVVDFNHVQGAFDGTQTLLPATRHPNWRRVP